MSSDPCGHPRLRSELATMLARTRGLPASPENLMVTHSIEQGIDLVARMLLQAGDVVVVEAFGYPPAWRLMEMAGAQLLPLPLDADGLDIKALEDLLGHQRVRAVFVTPYHQFPTTVVMSEAKRKRLVELAIRFGFAIIEDDYDHDFHYGRIAIPPIASGVGRASVIYISSLSNLLMPGASTGFVIAPAPVVERLANFRAASDTYSDAAMECAIAELFEDGEWLRHANRMKRICATRRDALATSLTRHLGGVVQFRVPDGGTSIWIRVDDAIDVANWSQLGEEEGVRFFDASAYEFSQSNKSYLRLGFSYLDENELDEAVQRMARALVKSRASESQFGCNSPFVSRSLQVAKTR
ncbi:MAG: PLP-dependent aminotransferase family protein [Pseudoxanthomonas sp.]